MKLQSAKKNGRKLETVDGIEVAICKHNGKQGPTSWAWDNAARLLACWNACEGLGDPAIVGEMVGFIKAIASRAEQYGMIKIGPNTEYGIAMLEILDRIDGAKKEQE